MANYRGNYTVARPVRERVSDDYRTQLGERRLAMTQDQWNAEQAAKREAGIAEYAKTITEQQWKQRDDAFKREQAALAWQDKERTRAENKPMSDAQLKKLQLETENLEIGLGNRDLRRVSPAEKARIAGKVFENFQFNPNTPELSNKYYTDKDFRESMHSAIVDAAMKGIPADEIAPAFGLQRLPATEKSWFGKETPISGRIHEGTKVILPRPQIDATGEPQSGVERGLANLNQQPVQDTPEVARAKALVTEFRRRSSEDPNWAASLSASAFDRIDAALDVIEGANKPVAQPEPQRPQGRIVSDIAIQDVNGDGKRDELDKQIAQSIDYVDRLEAKFKEDPTAETRLSPAARKKLAEMRLTAETYKSSYKRQRQAEINAAYGMGQQ